MLPRPADRLPLYLLERAATRTAAEVWLSVDRIILAGSHTHAGAGNYFGNTLYDGWAQAVEGFDAGRGRG